MAARGKRFPWEEKLLRSGYFVGAVLLHLVLFTLVAGYVVFRSPPPDLPVTVIPPPPQPPPDVPRPPSDNTPSGSMVVPIDTNAGDVPIPVHPLPGSGPGKFDFVSGGPGPGEVRPHLMDEGLRPRPTRGLAPGRVKLIREFIEAHRPWENILRHDPAGDFPVFVASYADGDWACNTNLDAEGNIVAGSIPNLVAKINEWTHREVNLHVVARPLSIGGPDLLAQKPPFIFLTGHKDFVLTDPEIENLREYLEMGGLVWGDNALAGRGSRFDVAFRREMARVIPNAPLQPLGADAGIFRGKYPFDQAPEGMNYRAEPIEHIDLDGQIAILYTPNDYSDLYTMRILPGDRQVQGTQPAPGSPLVTPGTFLYNRQLYFRNFTLPSSLAVQHLGLNIVTFLITRFDDQLQLAP